MVPREQRGVNVEPARGVLLSLGSEAPLTGEGRGTAAKQDPPRTGTPFAAGLIALAIVVAGVPPLILHFVTGPLGPFIGGLVAGSRVSGRPRELAIIALTVGVGLARFTGGKRADPELAGARRSQRRAAGVWRPASRPGSRPGSAAEASIAGLSST